MKLIHELSDSKVRQRLRYFYLIVLLLLCIATVGSDVNVKEGKEYTDFDHVALYILEYESVPSNYVPKILSSQSSNPYKYGPFLNVEERLPVGEEYTEAYINATEEDFGVERFVFSDDTLYYTVNHYESFSEITEVNILGGYYLFRGISVIFLGVGVVFLFTMLLFIKEVKAKDLIKDIVLDYNLFIEKCKLVINKVKEYRLQLKQKQASKKVEE